MSSAEYKAIHPVEYYRSHLDQEIRPDGRSMMDARKVVVVPTMAITTADSSSTVRQGSTSVVCGVKLELAAPKAEEPNRGYFVPNVDLTPMCSQQFKPGPPGDKAQVVSQLVLDIVNSSGYIDTSVLCIHPGKLAWCLYCDIVCTDYDGSVVDACVTALVAALNHLELPQVEYELASGDIKVLPERSKVAVGKWPVASTYAIVDGMLMADPTAEEEQTASGLITVATVKSKVCCVEKQGGCPISDQQLFECITQAKKRAGHVLEVLREGSS